MTPRTRADIPDARRIVVKVGSSSISGANAGQIGPLVDALAAAHERGTDVRLDENRRATRAERRSEYHERMDAKAEARAELQREREAGIWAEDEAEVAVVDADVEAEDVTGRGEQ